jgi:hypothetical protein
MTIDPRVLTDMPAQPLEAISPIMRNGDLLLCSANDPFSRLIGWSTKSPWTHVGFAWRWPEVGRVLALECVQHIGVHAVGMERFISQTSSGTRPYPGKIVLARHDAVAGLSDIRPLVDDAIDLMGDPFSPGEIVKIATRIAFGRFDRHMPEPLKANDEFICSEYIDRCFRRVGVQFRWNGRGFISPADIANDEHVHAVARFETR